MIICDGYDNFKNMETSGFMGIAFLKFKIIQLIFSRKNIYIDLG